jgi:NAD+ diphosphatase
MAIVNVFAGSPLDRASVRRTDEGWLGERLRSPRTPVVAMWEGKPLVTEEARIAYLTADRALDAAEHPSTVLFLGLDGDTPVFAVEMTGAADPTDGPLAGMGRFAELRGVALSLPGPEAAVIAAAKSLFDWHRRHGFCSACGAATRVVDGGWRRACPSCDAEHFPRVDPVVIMLPVANGRCLLGRNVGWPEGRMSALAGFMEPGESIEEACARELREEAGLVVTRVAYHSSQPWPFPSSLMIGLVAEVAEAPATPDGVELEELRWFTREEARAVLDGHHPEVATPGGLGVARQLLAAWVEDAA